jgi:hypothetical protein
MHYIALVGNNNCFHFYYDFFPEESKGGDFYVFEQQ